MVVSTMPSHISTALNRICVISWVAHRFKPSSILLPTPRTLKPNKLRSTPWLFLEFAQFGVMQLAVFAIHWPLREHHCNLTTAFAASLEELSCQSTRRPALP